MLLILSTIIDFGKAMHVKSYIIIMFQMSGHQYRDSVGFTINALLK